MRHAGVMMNLNSVNIMAARAVLSGESLAAVRKTDNGIQQRGRARRVMAQLGHI
jgi:hypothetical protein